METEQALLAWQTRYGGNPPLGFVLRLAYQSVWTRIHYLPDGVRPATNERDQKVAVARLSDVADELFSNRDVLVIALHLDSRDEEIGILRPMGATAISPANGWAEVLDDHFVHPGSGEFSALMLRWRHAILDPLWLAAARDRIGRVAVFCPATGDAFCPYDGGADFFVWKLGERVRLRGRFRAWLPATGVPGSLAPE